MTRVRCVLLISRLLALEAVNTRSCRVDAAASASHAVAGGGGGGGDGRRTRPRRNRPKVLVQPDTGEAERGRRRGLEVTVTAEPTAQPVADATETSGSAAPGRPSHPAGRREIYGRPPAGSGRSCQGETHSDSWSLDSTQVATGLTFPLEILHMENICKGGVTPFKK